MRTTAKERHGQTEPWIGLDELIGPSLNRLEREKEVYLFGKEEERKSFQDLGLVEELAQSLSQIGKVKPTLIQAATFLPIVEGQDVVIGAETGLLLILDILQQIL